MLSWNFQLNLAQMECKYLYGIILAMWPCCQLQNLVLIQTHKRFLIRYCRVQVKIKTLLKQITLSVRYPIWVQFTVLGWNWDMINLPPTWSFRWQIESDTQMQRLHSKITVNIMNFKLNRTETKVAPDRGSSKRLLLQLIFW